MKETERQYEITRLSDTIQEINRQLTAGEETCSEYQTDLQETLHSYWENVGGAIGDEAQFIEAVERQRNITKVIHRRHAQLQRMASSPYFGRIDFAERFPESLPAEQIYLGISNLTDPATGDLLIYDWRTPVSSMFYDYERGDAQYHCPAGTVSGTILLKRQYKITHGEMKYMFDADLKIDDEMLQELLSKSADDKMHTIVASIQREQNKVIRNEGHRLLIVQGPAGSGKTSIALHRVAFLLYRDRERITSRNVLILSPNHIFSDYISNVLPEMGEENVLQTTFQDYVAKVNAHLPIKIESRTEHLETLFSINDAENQHTHRRITNIRFKSSQEFERLLQNYAHYFLEQIILDYPPIVINGQTIFSREDWRTYYLKSFSFLPPARRLSKIREVLQHRLRPFVHGLRKEKEQEITASAEEVNEKTIKMLARVAARNDLNPLTAKIEKLTTLNSLTLYRKLFTDDAWFRRFWGQLPEPLHWKAIKRQTLRFLNDSQIPYEDAAPFLYFHGMLEGFPVKPEVKYLVIDEAQDYTTLQFKILAQLFPHCSWTILGDPAQSVHPYLQTADFENFIPILNIENHQLIRLSRSYRSTQQVLAFCQNLLPTLVKPESIERPGPRPQIVKLASNIAENPAILEKAIQRHQGEGLQSIALICKTARECQEVYEALHNRLRLSCITHEDDEFQRGIVIIPTYLAKGLEFDAVMILNTDADTYRSEGDRHILYTACTRALHRLQLFYTGTVSPFLQAIPPNLYESIETI